jgi:twitching motility protein PilT
MDSAPEAQELASMSTIAIPAEKIGQIALHNKLITREKWEECWALHQRTGGQLAVEEILIQKGYLTAKHIEAIRKALAAHLEKKAAGTPSGSSPIAPLSPQARPAGLPPLTASKPMVVPTPARPAGKDDSGELRFRDSDPSDSMAETKEGPAVARPSTPPGRPAPGMDTVDDAEEADEVEEAAEVAEDAPTQASGRAEPSPRREPASDGVQAVAERIKSPVAPGRLDPQAIKLLKDAVARGASDVHFAAGTPPFLRVHGKLEVLKLAPLSREQARNIVLGFMDDGQQQHFLRTNDLDFSFEHKELGRFRVNALEQFRGTDIVFRVVPSQVPTLESLGLPANLAKFTEWHQGLVLVTGPAGCGKSTTAAALVNLINHARKDHIITIEDPIEFIHRSAGCNVTQRQVPRDTRSFASALRAALREDPDVIMIGEMRDLDTVSLALRAAETGHLVIGTLHTKNAPRTIDRVVDVYPSDQQAQVRVMISESLRGVISQQLIPRADGKGRVAALEVLFVNNAVSNVIRDSKTFQLHSIMQTSRKLGQKLLDESLKELVEAGTISREEAAKAAENPKLFRGGA